jgi:chaperone required for assembly of F1-ATPase
MQKPRPKRFYETADFKEVDDGYRIVLDGKPVRTPARNPLALRTRALAEAVAAEWQAQGKEIDPDTMPLTRLANTALDGVASDMQAVAEDVLRYAGTDLLCYRAGGPERLVARQSEMWDPLIDWAASSLGARFVLAEGVMHVPQPREAIAAFGVHVAGFTDPLALAALHVATSLSGSALIAMAVAKGEISAEEAWAAAHVDEDWNEELWGEDYEATKRRRLRFRDFAAAAFVLEQARQ